MINIGLIGCGKWSEVLSEEIRRNKFFNLNSITCKNIKNKKIDNSIYKFDNIRGCLRSNISQSLFAAAIPEVNLELVELSQKYKYPLILEKPISNTLINAKKIKKISKNKQIIILPNLTNNFTESFEKIKNFVSTNRSDISEIIIYEGSNGPYRKKINPIWDWGFHSISLIIDLFGYDNLSKINNFEIKKDNNIGGIVTKYNILIDNKIKAKIINGNLFKKKIRKLKIKLNNKDILISDMIKNVVYFNNNIIFQNHTSPITSLLNKFYLTIKEKNYNFVEEKLDIACNTVKILEKYYKC